MSDWFLKARSYVEKRDGAWFILSAKYGLLDPDQKIEPYEVTLNTRSVSARRDWAQNVLKALETQIEPTDRVVILAGARYREFLTERLEDAVCRGCDSNGGAAHWGTTGMAKFAGGV